MWKVLYDKIVDEKSMNFNGKSGVLKWTEGLCASECAGNSAR